MSSSAGRAEIVGVGLGAGAGAVMLGDGRGLVPVRFGTSTGAGVLGPSVTRMRRPSPVASITVAPG